MWATPLVGELDAVIKIWTGFGDLYPSCIAMVRYPEYPVRTVRIYIFVAIALTSLTASAQSKTAGPCADKMTTVESNDCLQDVWKVSDAELNRTYAAITRKIGGTRLQDLRIAQRLWIQFRDANCKNASEIDTGASGGGAVLYTCLDSATRQRIVELRNIYKRSVTFPN
jgi:uncharacterized protein YecT (DUF1311 family)